jgi:valyl-tRNA synthetase
VGICYRCHSVIEPLVSRQWFVKTADLAKKAITAVKNGQTKLDPASWDKTFFDWLENIRDWCVSRQLWWGHRIPAFFCPSCQKTLVSREDLTVCPDCQGALKQDPDVLDTWFSSALWPFSTLGWPERTADLARYFPTTVLVTGFDIIFFWVARMMMMGLWVLDEVPFSTVVLHPLVRDEAGKKMSKSKGNVVDPIGIIETYGSDAFRFALTAQASQGQDLRLSENRIAGYGKFINKLWNAARFVLTNLGAETFAGEPWEPSSLPERWIKARLEMTAALCRTYLETFVFDRLAETIYHFVWDEFCDWYLELVKPVLFDESVDPKLVAQTRRNLLRSLVAVLELAHPIVPFVTEEIWSQIPSAPGFLMKRPYPGGEAGEPDLAALSQIGFLMDVVKATRSARADFGVPPGAKVAPLVLTKDPQLLELLKQYSPILLRLMGAESLRTVPEDAVKPKDAAFSVLAWGEVWTPLGGHIDLAVETARLAKEEDFLNREIDRAKIKLQNPEYVAKAPPEVVEETKERLAEMTKKAAAVLKSLAALKEMAP